MITSNDMYWSCHDLLSRSAMWSYAIGGRGVGKTYDAKKTRIKHYLKTGKRFIYMRRYDSEFDDKDKFFADVSQEFPDHEFMIHGMKGMMRRISNKKKNPHKWECVCYFVVLSKTLTKKSVPYPDVDYLIFDEFIIPKGLHHYLPDETTIFQDFYNTADRFEDRVRVLFLANAVTLTNPYFIAYKLNPRKNSKRFITSMQGYHCLEMIESTAYARHAGASKFGQMIKGSSYYDYAIGNTFAEDHEEFIAKKSNDAVCMFGILFDDKQIGVWADYGTGIYYLTRKIAKNVSRYALTRNDHSPDLIMIKRSSKILKNVAAVYMTGSMFFDSINTRENFNDILNYLNIR